MHMEGTSAIDCFVVIECYDEIIVHNIWFDVVDASSIQLLNLIVCCLQRFCYQNVKCDFRRALL